MARLPKRTAPAPTAAAHPAEHVNGDPVVMKVLVQKLRISRMRPDYLYQCGHTTGYAVPQHVIDAPGGGKVPVNPESVLSRNADRVVIRNIEGNVLEYPEFQKAAAILESDCPLGWRGILLCRL